MELGFTWEEYFSIRPDIIWYHGLFTKSQENLNNFDQLCIRELGQFLMYGGVNHWKKFSELWKEYKDIHGFTDSHENPNYSQKAKIRDMGMNGFYFGKGLSYEDGEPIGVLIPQPTTIDYHNDLHKEFFFKLFPFRFRYLPPEHKIQFLDFHLNETFKKDTYAFRLFLNNVKASYRFVFEDHFDLLNQYIDGLKDRIDKVDSENSKPSVNQIAAAIYYQQIARSIPLFEEGNKEKEIKSIAAKFGVSNNTLKQKYNKLKESGISLLNIIKDQKNVQAIKDILNGDQLALNELKKDIDKISNPLP